jgi:hypothetical protein
MKRPPETLIAKPFTGGFRASALAHDRKFLNPNLMGTTDRGPTS